MKKRNGFEADTTYRSDLSELERSIFDAYNSNKKKNYKSLLVCWEAWGDIKSFIGVEKGSYPWARYDLHCQKNPYSQLIIALDLDISFQKQWPEHYRGQLSTFEAFLVNPLIWIPDRKGIVPEKAKQAFMKSALKVIPDLKVITGGNPLAAKTKDIDHKNHLKLI